MKTLLYEDKASLLPDHASPQDLADKFGLFFIEKIEKIRRELPQVESVDVPLPPPTWYIWGISRSPSSSCSLDPIPTWLLKWTLDATLPHLVDFINLRLAQGTVLQNLKQALVRPLIKKPSPNSNELKNYRPVSNLSYVSKLMERVVGHRLNSHMQEYGLHESLQSAYKPGHSTETALLRVHNDILTNIDGQSVTMLIMLDLSAAFDTIDHRVLLDRMESTIGFTGVPLTWFASYLSHRSQSIQINQVVSMLSILLLFGVPQGSVLGSLLFLIYILPLGVIIHSFGFELHIYANDTQIYFSIKPTTATECIRRVEDYLSSVHQWMTSNFLKLNSDKTEVLLIGTYQQLSKYRINSISVAGIQVTLQQTPVRNLCVVFDANMSMVSHVSSVIKSVTYHTRNVSKIRKYLTVDSAKGLVNSVITSHLDYCNSLLAGICKGQWDRLERAHRCAACVVLQLPRSVTPSLQDLDWLPIRFRVKFKIAVLVFKSIRGLTPNYLSDLLSYRAPARSFHFVDRLCHEQPCPQPVTDHSEYLLHEFGMRFHKLFEPVKAWTLLRKF